MTQTGMTTFAPCVTSDKGADAPYTTPTTLPRKWVWNQRPECPFYLGIWLCPVCIRLRWDFRKMFCPLRGERK